MDGGRTRKRISEEDWICCLEIKAKLSDFYFNDKLFLYFGKSVRSGKGLILFLKKFTIF